MKYINILISKHITLDIQMSEETNNIECNNTSVTNNTNNTNTIDTNDIEPIKQTDK